MLNAITMIGEIGKGQASTRFIEGINIFINISTNPLQYLGIIVEDFDNKKINLYLYKDGASKGTTAYPFCPLTEPDKTLKKKVLAWFEQCGKALPDNTLLESIIRVINENIQQIISDITEKLRNIPKKTKRFLSLKIDDDYIGNISIFRDFLDHKAKDSQKRSSSTATCSICEESDKDVSGLTSVYKFYTIDKPGFITGGFDKSSAWKNYPVCTDCSKLLENGKAFIEDNLTFNFYGLRYHLIPQTLIGGEEVISEIIDILSDSPKRLALKSRIKNRITQDEAEILEYLSEVDDVITLNLLFIQKQQSAERILLHIEDVLPSRIKTIFEAKAKVERLFQLEYNFGKIRNFFRKSDEAKKESDLDKYFLEIVDRVFRDRSIDFGFLTVFHMARIRQEFVKEGYYLQIIGDAMMNIMFLKELVLINLKEATIMEDSIFNELFSTFDTLNTPTKKAIFLLGSLTQLLLNKQFAERSARPFMKKLKSLKMDERDIRSLLPEVQNKFEEYDAFDKGKRLIAEEVSTNFLRSGENWRMPVDEINFYFACGMNLSEKVANIVYSSIKKED